MTVRFGNTVIAEHASWSGLGSLFVVYRIRLAALVLDQQQLTDRRYRRQDERRHRLCRLNRPCSRSADRNLPSVISSTSPLSPKHWAKRHPPEGSPSFSIMSMIVCGRKLYSRTNVRSLVDYQTCDETRNVCVCLAYARVASCGAKDWARAKEDALQNGMLEKQSKRRMKESSGPVVRAYARCRRNKPRRSKAE